MTKKKISNQWIAKPIDELVKGHVHGPDCDHGMDQLDQELANRPPDNAGIVETVRWAMENEKILQNPPVQHMFCGTKIPCVYAGTIPTRTFSAELTAKKAAIRHAKDFVSVVLVQTSNPEKDEFKKTPPPVQSIYPSLNALLAVLDVNTDPDDPKIYMLMYDGSRSAASGEPVVEYLEDLGERVSKARYGDPLAEMNVYEMEAFVVDLQEVVRTFLQEKMRKREEAIKEAEASGVPVIDNTSQSPPAEEKDVDVAEIEEKILKMEEKAVSVRTPIEGRKKLEKKIAALRKKIASSEEGDSEEIPNGEDQTGVSS